jgi:hypothetical protein
MMLVRWCKTLIAYDCKRIVAQHCTRCGRSWSLAQCLVVRLDTFALASGQRINIAKSCVVPLGTLPSPPLTEAARAGPLTVVASK